VANATASADSPLEMNFILASYCPLDLAEAVPILLKLERSKDGTPSGRTSASEIQ
jgi:hypothetical protein